MHIKFLWLTWKDKSYELLFINISAIKPSALIFNVLVAHITISTLSPNFKFIPTRSR